MKIMALLIALAATTAWAAFDTTEAPRFPSVYQSVFADYQSFQDEALHDWRKVNDEMGRLGGHMGHLGSNQPAMQSPHDYSKVSDRPGDDRSKP